MKKFKLAILTGIIFSTLSISSFNNIVPVIADGVTSSTKEAVTANTIVLDAGGDQYSENIDPIALSGTYSSGDTLNEADIATVMPIINKVLIQNGMNISDGNITVESTVGGSWKIQVPAQAKVGIPIILSVCNLNSKLLDSIPFKLFGNYDSQPSTLDTDDFTYLQYQLTKGESSIDANDITLEYDSSGNPNVTVYLKMPVTFNYLTSDGTSVGTASKDLTYKDFTTADSVTTGNADTISAITSSLPKGYQLAKGNTWQLKNTDDNYSIDVTVDKSATNSNSSSGNDHWTKTVTFVNKDTGETISKNRVTEQDDETKTLSLPAGYVTFDGHSVVEVGRDTDSTIYVKKSSTAFEGTFATAPYSGDVQVYDKNGKASSLYLAQRTSWKVDREMTLNGEKYYRVGTNEWIKASTGYLYTSKVQNITTKSGSFKLLYSYDGKKKNRALTADSSWYSDRMATINNETMYRVSTDEWVRAVDIK